MRSKKPGTMLFLLLLVAMALGPGAGWAYETDDCIGCHDLASNESRLTMDAAAFAESVHGDVAECVDCHTNVEDEEHTSTPGSGAAACGECHDQENQHGLGGTRENRPQCYHCHTRHDIRSMDDPASTVHADRLEGTCGACHPAQSGQVGYFSWLPSLKISTHPKANLSGSYDMGNCLGCHQGKASHGLDAAINDDSCHRCHLTADGQNPMLGVMHPEADRQTQAGIFAVAVVYQAVIGMLLVGGMFFFVRKFSGNQRR